jgi:molybdate transport system regulatory protein
LDRIVTQRRVCDFNMDASGALCHALRMARLSIRIDFEPSSSALGPGMVELLARIGSHGSIRSAAASMNMSYRKAWMLIQEVQKTFDGPVVTAAAGGVAGGGSQLTELGEKLLQCYRRIETVAAKAVQPDLRMLSQLVKPDASPRRSARKAQKKPGSP